MSSRDRFLAALRGNPDGSTGQRVLYYFSRMLGGAIAGFFVIALATPARDGGNQQGFSLGLYIGAIAAGAVLALAIVTIARLLHPKDWPTAEEFRKGAKPPGDADNQS
jgi:hypothetical protein